MTTSTDIEAQLQAIRQAYCAALPEKLARIEWLWHQLQQDRSITTHFEEFYRLLHSMAGSAETFGLPELTQVARTLVEQLKQAREISEMTAINLQLAELSRIIQGTTQK